MFPPKGTPWTVPTGGRQGIISRRNRARSLAPWTPLRMCQVERGKVTT